MESYGYAVLYKKKKLDQNSYYFKPLYVIEGLYNATVREFLDETNSIKYPYIDNRILEDDVEFCIGEVYKEEELKKLYPDVKELNTLKMNLFKKEEKNLTIGIVSHDTININKIDINKNQITSTNISNRPSIGENKTFNPIANQFYKNAVYQFGCDFTLFLPSEVKKIIKMKDIEECINFINQIKSEKSLYYDKTMSKNENTPGVIISDDDLDRILLSIIDIEEIKEFFQQLLKDIENMENQYFNNYQEVEDENIDGFFILSIDELRIKEESVIDYITHSNQIQPVLSELESMITYYEQGIENVNNFKKIGINFNQTELYFRARIKEVKSLLALNDLEKIKSNYLTMYENSRKEMELVEQEFQTIEEENKKEEKEQETKNIKQLNNEVDLAIEKLNELVGLENVKEIFEEVFSLVLYKMKTSDNLIFEPDSMHMVFTGNPGTGKTTVAEIIAPLFHQLGYLDSPKVAYVAAQDLVGQYVGHTAPRTEALIKKNRGGIIVLDEAYILAGEAQQFGNEAITVLLKEMEKNRTMFIFAGYKKEMEDFIKMNSGIKSRIGTFIDFRDYTEEELFEIFKRTLENTSSESIEHQLIFSNEAIEKVKEIIHDAIEIKDFGNGRFIKKLFNNILRTHAKNTRNASLEEELYLITEEDIPDDIMERILFENSESPYGSTNVGFNAKIKKLGEK